MSEQSVLTVVAVSIKSSSSLSIDTTTTTVNLISSSIFHNNNVFEWPILLLSLFVFLGAIGNLLVCVAIISFPKLQNATNYYLLYLAATDLLVSVIVIPLAIIKIFYKTWILGDFFCMLWIFFDVLLCTTSIMLLCVISCERFIGINDPLKNLEKSKTRSKIIIVLVTLVSVLLSSPVLILGSADKKNIIRDYNCALYNNHFIVYGSILSFLVPLIIMIIMYTLTVHRLSKKFQNLKRQPVKNDSIGCLNKFKNYLISACVSKDEKLNCFNYKLKINKIQKDEKYVENNEVSENIKNAELASPKLSISLKDETKIHTSEPIKTLKQNINTNFVDSMSHENQNTIDDSKSLKRIVHRHRLVRQTINVFQKTAVKNEQKAVKVLGIVFVVFVIAWVPFAIVNMLSALCPNCDQYPPILDFLVWLGYISSCINPLIYTIFSEKFRKAFKLILCCKFRQTKSKSYSFKNFNEFKFSRERKNSGIINNRKSRSVKLSIVSFSQSKLSTESSNDEFTRMGYLRFIKPQTNETILESENSFSN